MRAAILNFVIGTASYGNDLYIEMERFSSKRVISVNIDIVVIDADNPERKGFSVFRFGHHASANFELRAFGEDRFGYGLRLAFAFAISVFGRDIDVEEFIDFFAIERFFDTAQDAAVTVKVSSGIGVRSVVEDFAGVIAHHEDEGDDAVFFDMIKGFRRSRCCILVRHNRHQKPKKPQWDAKRERVPKRRSL